MIALAALALFGTIARAPWPLPDAQFKWKPYYEEMLAGGDCAFALSLLTFALNTYEIEAAQTTVGAEPSCSAPEARAKAALLSKLGASFLRGFENAQTRERFEKRRATGWRRHWNDPGGVWYFFTKFAGDHIAEHLSAPGLAGAPISRPPAEMTCGGGGNKRNTKATKIRKTATEGAVGFRFAVFANLVILVVLLPWPSREARVRIHHMRGHDLELTAEELALVRRRSDVMGILLVLSAWAVIAAAMAMFAAWPNPLTFVLAIMLIGSRQLGLAILMHDAAHQALARSHWLNEFLGSWASGDAVAADLYAYRPYHLKHHARTQQADDPDLVLSAPFPITRASFARKLLRDLSGQTGFKQRRAQIKAALGKSEWPLKQRLDHFAARLGRPLAVNALFFGALAAIGYWWLYPALWLLPLLTWYMAVTRIRNIAEHAMVPDNDDPFRNARTTYASPLVSVFLAPYWVNYHVDHHLLMWVPCFNLPKLHRLLEAKGLKPLMEVRLNYWSVLGLAASKAAAGAS